MKKKLISILCALLLIVIPVFAQTSDTLKVVLNLEAMTTVEWFIGETEPNFDNWEYDVDELTLELDKDNLTNPVWLGILTNEENLGTLSISGTALLKDGTETTDIIPLTVNKGQDVSASVLKEFTTSTSESVDVEYTDETGTGYRIIPIPLEIAIDYNDVITKTAPSTYETTLTATYTVTN